MEKRPSVDVNVEMRSWTLSKLKTLLWENPGLEDEETNNGEKILQNMYLTKD